MDNIILNRQQEYISAQSIPFFESKNQQLFQIDGIPGSGKTTLLRHILARNKIPMSRVAAMAYTGAAAINLKLNGFPQAQTIHSFLYNVEENRKLDEHGNFIYDTFYNTPISDTVFVPKTHVSGIDVMFIDEGGMVPEDMGPDIKKHKIKIIVCGDLSQLPPIHGKSAFLRDGKIYHLTQPMRQDANSGIFYVASRIREGLPVSCGYYGNCWVIYDDELTDEMLLRTDLIMCGKNKTRERINKRLRYIKGYKSDLPQYGERVIFRNNNSRLQVEGINIANGLRGRIINSPDPTQFDGKTFSIDFKPDLFDKVFSNIRINYEYFTAPYEEKAKIRRNKYRVGELLEFGDCITTHLAQGMTVRNSIYISEYLSPEINQNLDCTGSTRAKNGLIYVLRKKRMWNMSK